MVGFVFRVFVFVFVSRIYTMNKYQVYCDCSCETLGLTVVMRGSHFSSRPNSAIRTTENEKSFLYVIIFLLLRFFFSSSF